VPTIKTPRSSVRRIVQAEAGAWGVLTSINNAFIQPLLIASGAGQLALGLYISGSSIFNFGAGWIGPTLCSRVGSVARTTLSALTFSRLMFLAFTGVLVFADHSSATLLIALILLWGLGEGLALPLWTSFISGMAPQSERGRWIAMRAQAATLFTIPVLSGILLLVLFASREDALPIAYSVAAIGSLTSLYFLRQMFARSPVQDAPPRRSLMHTPQSPDARRFLLGVFLFWFASALTWPIVPRYLVNDLNAPTAFFAVSPIVGAITATYVQPRWGKLADLSGPKRILLLSGIGSAIVPLLWAVAPVYWVGFGIDFLAYCVWPGHVLGLTLRALELAETEADRPMMLGWTNLAQGAGACISPLIASLVVTQTGVAAILVAAFALRAGSALVMSGVVTRSSATEVEAVSQLA
jgi:MFS family permease